MFLDGDGQARERFTAVLGDEVMEDIDSTRYVVLESKLLAAKITSYCASCHILTRTSELSDEEEAGAGKGNDDGVAGTDDS